MKRRPGTTEAPTVPAMTVPPVPAPPMPPAPMQVTAPPVAVAEAPAVAPPAVPGYPPIAQAPMQEQLAAAVYQQPAAPPVPVPAAVAMTQPAPTPPPADYSVPSAAPVGSSPMHMALNGEPVKVFKVVPAGETCEGEITKAEIEEYNGKNQIKLQLKATWPAKYEGAVFYDNVYLTEAAQWRYKSLLSACVDEAGNRLLDPTNRFFTGKGPDDLLGNIVRFRTDEPTPGKNGDTYFNKIKGGFEQAFDTGVEEAPATPAAVGQVLPAAGSVPPVPQF